MAFDSINISKSGTQRVYTGRGPLDAKSLIATYDQLLDPATWTEGTSIIAYNGMVTAVWLNTADPTKNGVYFLHDSTVTSKFKAPDVSKSENWHKLGGLDDLPGLVDQIKAQVDAIQVDLETVQTEVDELQDSATVVIEVLPAEGVEGKIYVVTSEAKTYIWHDGKFLPVGDGGGDITPDIQIISGGGPSV